MACRDQIDTSLRCGLRTPSGKRQTRILWRCASSMKGNIAASYLPYGRRSGAASCLVSHSFEYFSGLVRIFRFNRYHVGTLVESRAIDVDPAFSKSSN
jgi:hypothetical protein